VRTLKGYRIRSIYRDK